ncbi:hypothetical protein R5W23_001511 [Gemmata sp. JC673]|uniref:Uncharacterized protein n=1 Tax=Gemmata algarum TaxID=2975278 RepID=A0ABU5F0K9_9BACT|nr:hypothetical protein [Gemmata algarum]MDY3560282.1 hypothetical protein [Gemmata algarum]
MIIIFGEKSYGKVDRVPGVCYVVTTFAHLNYLPLFPLRSYIVIEGTESGGEFRGKQIGISLKSMIAGYARVWIGALTILAGIGAGVELNQALRARQMDGALIGLIAAGVLGLLSFFVNGKVGAGFQVAAHAVSAVMWFVLSGGAPNRQAANATNFGLFLLFVANVGLLLFGLTRLFDHAGAERKRELFNQLGVEVPDDDDDEPRESKWEEWDASEDRRRR